jgi:hypothetical protein
MKWFTGILLIAAALSTFPAHAANLNILQGYSELGVQGTLDFDTVDDTLFEANLSYGVFWWDFFLLGGRAGITTSDSVTQWRLGAFAEYHFFLESRWVPFLGISTDVAGTEIDFEPITTVANVITTDPETGEMTDTGEQAVVTTDRAIDETAFVLGTDLGVKYFFTESVALSTVLGFDWASSKIFASDDKGEDTNWDIQFGLRFFF